MKATEYLKKVKGKGQRSVLEPWLEELTVLANANPPLSLDQILEFLKQNGVAVTRSPLYRYLQRHVWKTRGRKAKGLVVRSNAKPSKEGEPRGNDVVSQPQGVTGLEVVEQEPLECIASSPAVIDEIASAPVDLESLGRSFKKHQRQLRGKP